MQKIKICRFEIPVMMNSSYRPRNPGHDYYGKGVYLITLVVRGREPLLASFISEGGCEKIVPTALGEEMLLFWGQTAERQAAHGNRVVTHACVCMPDHFHGVIEVLEPMEWNLGDIMQAFKAACTSRWRKMNGVENRPILVDSKAYPEWLRKKALIHRDENALINNLSQKQRQEYYTLVGRERRPLFDDNYDDTVCIDERHREAMIAYVQDNPRRALLRRAMPDVMRRCLHIQLAGHSYGAFGNLFLLRWARKIQVQCHRKHPTTGHPYEETDDYARQHDQWVAAILEGYTVIVTPGISRGELLMKNECLEKGYPLIHIQKEPITPYWKPERQRFDACANGSLLILAPWGLDQMPDVNGVPSNSDYGCFHNMNRLAKEICSFRGAGKIIRR